MSTATSADMWRAACVLQVLVFSKINSGVYPPGGNIM